MLETNRLILRQWQEKDFKSLVELYSDPRVMEFWEVRTLEESRRDFDHFVSSIEKHGWGFWAAELKATQQFIGLIGLENIEFQAHFTPAVEIGWRLHYDFWGQGYATEGAAVALQYGFNTLNLNEIVAFTPINNMRSRNVMERLGMKYDPKDDFDDPDLPKGHPFRRLVLYRLKKKEWENLYSITSSRRGIR